MSVANERLIGRIAVKAKLITMEQLAELTREQGQKEGVRLGDLMVARGLITEAQLHKLFQVQQQVMAQHAAKKAVEEVAPTPEPSAPPATTTAAEAPATDASASAPSEIKSQPTAAPMKSASAAGLLAELERGVAAGASDLHFHSGAAIQWRMLGVLQPACDAALEAEQNEKELLAILNDEERAIFDEAGEIDMAYTAPGGQRFRVNLYRQQRGVDGVFRALPATPPSLEDLELPNTLTKLINFHQGLILLTGPSGCGKSSTMAALVDILNSERSDHILCVEDPIEVIHPSKRCLVNQRQVKRHTESFARALRGALREDPDVIAIGELRDLETISLALTAAETGHLVLATLHTSSSIRTIERLIGVFPPNQQNQVRTMLSESLRAIVSQCLLPTADATGRVPALEILVANKAVGNLIRENKTIQIRSILQTGASHGMCLLDDAIAAWVKEGRVTREDALRFAEDPRRFGGEGAPE